MKPDERLKYHQEHSIPILDRLRKWIDQQFEQKMVEPNSALGGALEYFINHWYELTQFTRIEKAPLDNNIVERALRIVALHRKNSLFFRNDYGAYISDILMSIIATCDLNGVESYQYLVDVIRHSKEVKANPVDWLPWIYKQRQSEPVEAIRAGPGSK
jgi:hypothetical protein